MLDWLAEILGAWIGGIAPAILNLIRVVVGGIAGVLDFIFGAVKGAWNELATQVANLATLTHGWVSEVWKTFDLIITYYIPKYAMEAWWWVTTPLALSEVLLYYVLHWLEQEAWTVAQYLGEFALALVLRELKRFLLLAEAIVAAIL